MIVLPFEYSHLELINDESAKMFLTDSNPIAVECIKQSNAYSGFIGDKLVACCGLTRITPSRGYLWAFIAADIGASGMVMVTKAVSRYLAIQDYDRLEAVVVEGFEPGMRWMNILGFSCETPIAMQKYLPDGRNAFLYSRIK